MSNTPTKKSVFDRIGGSSSSGATMISNKSTHGFCNAFIKNGTCPLGETCKYIHEQPNIDKQSGSKEEMRITKTITRVVDMSSPPIKSTITVSNSNEQRPVVLSNSMQSTRTVVESGNTTSTEHSERRLSGSDRKQSQSRTSDSKPKSSSEKKPHSSSSSHETRHSSTKRPRSHDSDSPVSSASDSEYTHSSHKHKKKSDSHSTSSKHKTHPSVSPSRDTEETLNDQLIRQSQAYNKSPKRTIVITERKPEESSKRSSKSSKSKPNPDIEFLASKKVNRDKKAIETIHQQTENPKKTVEVKRERKSPSKSTSSDQSRRHSSSTHEKHLQIKVEQPSSKTPNSSERSDRTAPQSTPPIVQLSPTPGGSSVLANEPEKSTPVQPPSPICVILDDDSSPAPSIEKKTVRQTSEKKSNDNDKSSSKQNKRSRDSDKDQKKEKSTEHSEIKRKRLIDGSSKKVSSSNKSGNEDRSTSNRSDSRRSANTSREESSSRKYEERSQSKTGRTNDSKDRNLTASSSSSKSRSNKDRHESTRLSPEKKSSTHRRGKEKGLENVTDSEEHLDEPLLPKQTAIEAYMSMDWSLLSRDKRIPLNTQVTSRVVHSNHFVSVCDRLLTDEQKEKLNGIERQSLPLTHFVQRLQNESTSPIVQSSQRRFGSCAKDMLDMRHKWFTRSIEPAQQYEFINKDHYIAFQQAINSLLDKTSTELPTVQIETTTADVLLS